MNKLLIAVGVIFLLCMITGYTRGFIKSVASLAATIGTIALVVFLSPYTSNAILKFTPIEEMVQEKCEEILMLGDSATEEASLSEPTREEQIMLLENADMPKILRELLLENNNSEIYKALGVSTFREYLGSYLAKCAANVLGFLLTLLIVTVVVRMILYVFGIISDLPVIGGVNRLAGGVLGVGKALVFVWVLFILMTLIYDTQLGKVYFEYIEDSEFLTFLYENNILMNYVTRFRG